MADHDTATAAPAMPRVAVLGAGSWGTALAALIARHGHPTVLWGRDAAIAAAIAAGQGNTRYLPGIALPDALEATTDLAAALSAKSICFCGSSSANNARACPMASRRSRTSV